MKKLWIGIIAIVIILAAGFFFFQKRRANHLNQFRYETAKAERGDIEVKVLSTGTIQPYTRVEVNSPISGRIDRVEVDEGDAVKEGDVLAWISSEDRIALLDAARSELEKAQEKKDEAALKSAKTAYEVADKAYKPVPLTNSISGEVINRSCEPGQNVSSQSILFVIADRLVAGVEVDEADIGKIRLGQDAWIMLDAFPDERVQGRVTKIAREGRIVSGVVVYDVMVEPLRAPSHWSAGMTANVEFVVEKREDVLIIPRRMLKERNGRKFVIVSADRPVFQEVEVGISDGRMIEVTSGLKEGEEIILTGENDISRPRSDMPPPLIMMRPR
jgi:macrolide-specific efflux system membrane fusion protein